MTPPPRKYAEAPGTARSAAEMRPPADDSATAIVSLRSTSRRASAVACAISSSRLGPVMASRDIVARSSRQEGTAMIAMWVKARVKPDQRKRFLEAIEIDALASERDEPGCYRFNVLQDEQDPDVYYFYEVYKDQAALEAHRTMPHYATWRAAADTLDGPTQPTRCATVFPSAPEYWTKR